MNFLGQLKFEVVNLSIIPALTGTEFANSTSLLAQMANGVVYAVTIAEYISKLFWQFSVDAGNSVSASSLSH